MQHKIFATLNSWCFLTAAILILAACNGTDNAGKSKTDSAASPTRTAKSTKEGKTSITMSATKNGKLVKDAHGVYNQAEVSPAFPGGKNALSDYISNHLTYSQTAIDSNISGTIHVGFIVDEQGKVRNPQVMDNKSLNQGLNEETLKMFENMPLWTPGLVKGRKVKTRMELPVTFQLEDDQ
jgi:protein TonB